MIRSMTALADRLVSLVAPKAEAAACTPSNYRTYCSCTNGYVYTKPCSLDYYCHETCTGCTRSSIHC